MASLRPKSPNMQNYRPQLTSVMSFGHRLSGATLAVGVFGLSTWLVSAAVGPSAFETVQAIVFSVPGRSLMFLATLVFFYHLCNGIRHLIWDNVQAFSLPSIYIGGWIVLGTSLALTLGLWIWVLA